MEHKSIETVEPLPDTLREGETVSLCSGGGCCPQATFCQDGPVCVFEGDRIVKLNYHQAAELCKALIERGYAGP